MDNNTVESKLPEGEHIYKVFHCFGCQTCWELNEDDTVTRHPHILFQVDITDEYVALKKSVPNTHGQ